MVRVGDGADETDGHSGAAVVDTPTSETGCASRAGGVVDGVGTTFIASGGDVEYGAGAA